MKPRLKRSKGTHFADTLLRYWAEKTFFIMGYHHDRHQPHTMSLYRLVSSWDILSAITRTHLFLTVILSPPQTNRESFLVSHPLRIGRKKASLWPSARSIWTLWETCSTANPTLAPCDDTYTHSLLEIRSDGKREKIGRAWRRERRRMSGVIAHCLWTKSARRGREINDAHWRRTWDACFRE